MSRQRTEPVREPYRRTFSRRQKARRVAPSLEYRRLSNSICFRAGGKRKSSFWVAQLETSASLCIVGGFFFLLSDPFFSGLGTKCKNKKTARGTIIGKG